MIPARTITRPTKIQKTDSFLLVWILLKFLPYCIINNEPDIKQTEPIKICINNVIRLIIVC